MRWPKLTLPPRAAMFVVGASAFYHEVFISSATAPERPWVLAIAGGLMGLPFFFSAPSGPGGGTSTPRPSGGWNDDDWEERRESRRREVGKWRDEERVERRRPRREDR